MRGTDAKDVACAWINSVTQSLLLLGGQRWLLECAKIEFMNI